MLNSLLQAPTVTGRSGNTSYGLPADDVAALLSNTAASPSSESRPLVVAICGINAGKIWLA